MGNARPVCRPNTAMASAYRVHAPPHATRAYIAAGLALIRTGTPRTAEVARMCVPTMRPAQTASAAVDSDLAASRKFEVGAPKRARRKAAREAGCFARCAAIGARKQTRR